MAQESLWEREAGKGLNIYSYYSISDNMNDLIHRTFYNIKCIYKMDRKSDMLFLNPRERK